jgi:DNA invertase Pin-like site-specific DNA recombinase
MRAVGIVRQSNSRGKSEGLSPAEQRGKIEAYCAERGWELVAVHEEVDVSGGRSLDRRPGLGAAVRAIEAGEADVVVASEFTRLFRNIRVQEDVIERVVRAGGEVVAVDLGSLGGETSSQWMTNGFLGVISEGYRRQISEKVKAAHATAIEQGRHVARLPIGYLRQADGSIAVDEAAAPAIRSAFEMKAAGETVNAIRAMMRDEYGIHRAYSATQKMLANPIYVGTIVFGKYIQVDAHEAIVDQQTFDRAQTAPKPFGGRKSPSELLLARLGVLRCGSCGSRMVSASAGQRDSGIVRVYRCPPNNECPRHQSITASIAEEVIVDAVRRELKDARGRSGDASAALRVEVERTEKAYGNAVEASLGLDPAVVGPRLRQFQEARDEARRRLAAIGGRDFFVMPGVNWDEMSREAQRQAIASVIEVATVSPGESKARRHALERVSVTLRPGAVPQRALDQEAQRMREDVAADGLADSGLRTT